MDEYYLCALLFVYVVSTLTIPLWVPIVKRFTGDCGVFWVFSTLTYYAFLAWLVFAALLLFLLFHWPSLGSVWLCVLVGRVVNFARLRSRSPAELLSAHQLLSGISGPTPAAAEESGVAKGGDGGLGRVLLVGNGPSMKARQMGSFVDSFDTVVRFNSFVTAGMEEHTGSKTSLWCHMMQWYHTSSVDIRSRNHLPTCYAWNHVVLAPLFFVPNYLIPMLPPPNAMTWSVTTYWKAHRRLGLRLHQVPTTGFVMLMRLLETVERVHLVGFDGFAIGKELHYYQERRMHLQVNAAGALLHDWVAEQKGIQQLIDEGRVVLI
ncbi:hypothetical protein AB1Y20_014767 [Prymnesium parvum]